MAYLSLGAFPAASGTLYESYGVSQGLQYHGKQDEKYTVIVRVHFLLQCVIYWRGKLLMQRWLV